MPGRWRSVAIRDSGGGGGGGWTLVKIMQAVLIKGTGGGKCEVQGTFHACGQRQIASCISGTINYISSSSPLQPPPWDSNGRGKKDPATS